MARRVSVARLKARLSEYLAAVKAGGEVIVTDRGRPVARLTGLAGAVEEDARVSRLVRAGLARPAERPLGSDFFRLPRPSDPEGRALRSLLEERGEGW